MGSTINVHDAIDETAFDADHGAVADLAVVAQLSSLTACRSRE